MAGKINYAGTKRWLEEHLDMDTTSDVLANVQYVLCLDSLAKNEYVLLYYSTVCLLSSVYYMAHSPPGL